MPESGLNERSRRILATLVREHIDTGEAVSSQALAERGVFGLSSATLRNELVRLEELGYLHQPHTSAGRVPTDAAYRCYVDMLLGSRRPSRGPSTVEAQLVARAGEAPLMDAALASVSHVLSAASHHLGFAVVPTTGHVVFHRIDFVPLGGQKVLVVVVERGGRVTNKAIEVGDRIEPDQLRHAANYLNEEFAGLNLGEVRSAIAERIAWERGLYDELLRRALRLAQAALAEIVPRGAIYVEGAASLIEAAVQRSGGVSMTTLRALVEMLEEKDRLLRLLTEYIEGPGLTVVIGHEHSSPDLRECSLVTAPFGDGTRTGAVGVIGPTRMRYSRAIAVVERVASTVSHLLSDGPWDPTAPAR